MGYNRDELKKKDFLTLKNAQTSKIEKIVAPNKLQVGLNDPEFLSETILYGPATAHAGITGSITKLPDGNDFLRATDSGNVLLTTGSDGSVTITATGFTNNPLNVETTSGLKLSSGTEYDGSAELDLTLRVYPEGTGHTTLGRGGIVYSSSAGLAMDIMSAPNYTSAIAADDYVLFANVSATSKGTQKSLVSDLLALGTAASVAYPITFGDGIEDTAAAASDWDNTANVTIAVDVASNGALSFATGELYVNPNTATTASAAAAVGDSLIIYDTSATATRKVNLQEVVNLMHADGPLISTLTIGNGLELNSGTTFDGQNARSLSVDIDGATINLDSSGISVAKVPQSLTSGDGISTLSYDGSQDDQSVSIDLKSGTALSFSSGELQWDPSAVSSGTATINDTLVVSLGGSEKSVTLDSVKDLLSVNPDVDWIDYGSSISTTSSLSMVGGDGVPNQAVQYGSDIFFFVSGSKNARQGLDGGSAQAVSAFGGDVVVSGSFYVDENTLVVDAANNRIGIGDSSPDHTLDVAGNIGIPSSGYINIGDTDGSSGYGLRESSGDMQYKDSGGSWTSISQAPPDAEYIVLSADSTLTDERVFAVSTGLKSADAGAGSSYTISIDNASVATLSGSQFSGNIGITGSLGVTGGISGSITTLTDGTSYIKGSTVITVASSSGDQITLGLDRKTSGGLKVSSGELAVEPADFAGTGLEDDGSDNLRIATAAAGDGLTGGGGSALAVGADTGILVSSTAVRVDNSVVATLTGSQFSGNIGVTGSLGITQNALITGYMSATSGITGSLTQLVSGDAYLKSGNNISVSTGSDGSITISAVAGGGGVADGAAQYLVLEATSSLTAERVLTKGTGISTTDAGAGSAYTIAIDDSVVATLTGSQFSGNIGVTGSLGVSAGITGSITQLSDGTAYLRAGNYVTLSTGSDGSVTINSPIDNSIVATLTGSEFGSNSSLARVGITGSLGVTRGISGSLTTLTDGTPYLIAGNNIRIDSGSDSSGVLGSITIHGSAGGGGGSGDPKAQYLVLAATASLENERVFAAGTGISTTDAGAGGSYSVAIDDSVVATISGSTFTGDIVMKENLIVSGTLTALEFHSLVISSSIIYKSGSTKFGNSSEDVHTFTGAADFNTGLSGSLTRLVDGTPFIRAGSNVTIESGSGEHITISASTGTSGDTAAQYLVLSATSSLDNERVFNPSTGISSTDAGAGGNYTLSIDDSVVATLTGSQFSGNIGVTGSLGVVAGITGSITKVTDGTSYIKAGSNITVTSASNGSITIASSGTTYTAGDGLDLSGTEFSVDLKSSGGLEIDSTELAVDNSVVATLTGSQFSGNVGVTGSLGATTVITSPAISGSLTHLSDGTSYLIAGSNVTLTTGSSGAVTITSTGGIDGSGASNRIATWSDSDTLTSDADLTWNGTTLYASSAGITLNVQGDAVLNGTVVINQSGADEDFRVETQNKISALQVDGGTDQVLLFSGSFSDAAGYGSSAADPDPRAFTDTNFFVSGAIGSRATATKGTSVFGGDTFVSGTLFVQSGLSGSLTHLSDGTSYLIAGSGISISSASSGAVTITGNVGDITGVTAGTGLTGGGTSGTVTLNVDNSVVATLTGSQFSGNVGITGSLGATSTITSPAISGSLTHLSDGTSYLIAGNNIQIATGSSGAITITGTSTGDITSVVAGTGLTGGGASGDVTLNVDNSVVSTLTGSQFSGNVGVTGSLGITAGISGSLTKLTDGTSYLIAGSNMTITTGSSGAVTIAASGGEIAIVSGSETVSSISTLNLTNLGIINDLGGGTVAVTGSIGEAEDGTYKDGLFSTFTSKTPVGTAVDRFNEVLKALSPAPAPDLDNINAAETGVFTKLSFGAASSVGGYTNVGSSAGYGSAVDVNGSYQVATSSNNIRMATFNGSTAVTGTLNSDISPSNYSNGNTNYTTSSFGDADQGVLRLMVNGSNIKEIDLTVAAIGSGVPGSGAGDYVNSDGSGFISLSQTGSAVFEDASTLVFFQHRTGQYTVSTDDQIDGWNYARVLHVLSGSTKETNYMEWVNDSDSNALAASNETIDSFDLGDGLYLSGIQYYISGTASYKVDVSNVYRNVYSGSTSFNTSNCSVSDQAIPALDTGAGENSQTILKVTGSATVTATKLLNTGITVSANVTHPLKSNLSSGGSVTSSGILLYTASNDSTVLLESFKRENYRITSASYDNQASVTAGAATWDSTTHLSASADQTDGLIFYNEKLYTPTNSLLSGDFRNSADGGSITYAPTANPNYSGLSSGTKTFYRYFKNTSGDIQRDISVDIDGSGTIVQQGSANNTSRLSMLVKLPDTGNYQTGWLDMSQGFETGSYGDQAGCLVGSLDSSLDAVNIATFGTQSLGSNEYVVMKIEADAAWTGYVDDITVSFGAGTGTAPSEAPALDDIDCDDSGTGVKLSFGSTQSISGYTNVGTTAGFSAVDVNGDYTQTSSGNNLRRAVFDGSTVIDGTLNEDVSANGSSYVANAFSSGAFGSIKLEVNGSIVRVVDLESFYDGTSVNSNSSGFTSLLAGTPGEYSGNSVPDYTLIYRTGTYQIGTSDQRDGWNYARVLHSVGGSDTTTNYVEWVNDPNSNALTTGNEVFDNFGSDATLFYQSGVKYFISCTSSFAYSASNVYRNVYSRSSTAVTSPTRTNISVSQIAINGTGVTNSTNANYYSSLADLDTGVADCEQKDINITGSISFTPTTSLVGPYGTGLHTASISGRASHPMKSNVTTSTFNKANFLVFSASQNSNLYTEEFFDDENYRLQSGSFATQGSIAGSGWNPTVSMNENGSAGYYDGLLLYNGYLVSPKTGSMGDGDFRSVRDGGSLQSPDSNVNYSSLGFGERNYTRYFENNTTNDVPQINVMISGSATLVSRNGPNSGSLGTNNNFHCSIKIPGKTGWLDLARASAGAGNTNNGDGGLSGDLTATIISDGVLNICTFNGQTQDGTTSGEEYVLVRFTTHKDWTGKISAFKVGY